MSSHTEANLPAVPFPVGDKLLALRQAKGLSQREVARRAGMTNGNLSLIEQGKVSPSIQSLEKVLSGMGMDLPSFFASPSQITAIALGAQDFVKLSKGQITSWLKMLEVENVQRVSLVKDCVPKGATSRPAWVDKQQQFAGFVVEGVLTLKVGSDSYTINRGEGYQLSSGHKFEFANTADQFAVVVSVVVS